MKYTAILFDMDGTLNESAEGITKSAAYACEKMGMAVPPQHMLEKFVGPPLLASFMEYAGMTEEEAHRAIELYRERFSVVGWKENSVYPGMAPLLKALKANGVYLGIASAKPEIFVKQTAEYFGIDKYFDALIGTTLENTSADKCELLRAALPKDIDLSCVAMVGDREFDMQAARKLGVTGIGVLYGYGDREELENSGADILVETVSDLYDVLLPGVRREEGLFISFEGADGCGKSTQMKLLEKYLLDRGYEVVVSREPGGCPISERIRELVLDIECKGMSAECEALLFAASRAEHVRTVIRPALKSGKIMLCDRFLDSSIAYQARGRELGDDFIRLINKPAGEARPNRTLLFVGQREKISQRLRANANLDRMEIEKDSFVRRVYEAYDEIHSAEPDRVHIIDSNGTIEEIFEAVKKDIDELLG